METWAHGLDVGAAVGAPPNDTDRLAHVAWLATRALPYAYTVAGREPPSAPLRVELTLPVGRAVEHGSPNARRIASLVRPVSTAACSCTGQRRADAPNVHAVGAAAEDALDRRPRVSMRRTP